MSSRRSTSDAIDFGIALNLSFGAFKDALHTHLAKLGFEDLGGSFGYVLRALERDHAGSSLKDLAAALGITPQGALKIVDDMSDKGYVTRATDLVDARVKRIRLDARGEKLLREARAFHVEFEQRLVRRLGAADVHAARRVLEFLSKPASGESHIRMQML